MAAEDYTVRDGLFPMTPQAYITADMPQEAGNTVVPISAVQHVNEVDDDEVFVGMACLMNEEILRLVAITETTATFARGCADTIPQFHKANSIVWFMDGWAGSDEREYLQGEVIGVKALPRTAGAVQVPIQGVPPNVLEFKGRQFRPYPPAGVLANGTHWGDTHIIGKTGAGIDPLVLTWTHRDRITQHDRLVDHLEASIGPETGVTYTIQAYNASNTLRKEVTGITGDTWSYALADAQADYGITAGTGPASIPGYILLKAVRDGVDSWQIYRIPISITNEL